MDHKINNTNNNCRFCLRIFEDLEERIGITSQISDEFRNITQTEVKKSCKQTKIRIEDFVNFYGVWVDSSCIEIKIQWSFVVSDASFALRSVLNSKICWKSWSVCRNRNIQQSSYHYHNFLFSTF